MWKSEARRKGSQVKRILNHWADPSLCRDIKKHKRASDRLPFYGLPVILSEAPACPAYAGRQAAGRKNLPKRLPVFLFQYH